MHTHTHTHRRTAASSHLNNRAGSCCFCFVLLSQRAISSLTLTPATQLLCLNSGFASFRGRIWRPVTSQRSAKAVPIQRLLQMQPTNEAFFSLFLDDALLLCFVASHIPRFFALPKKKKERKKERKKENGNITWHRSSLSRAWTAEIAT